MERHSSSSNSISDTIVPNDIHMVFYLKVLIYSKDRPFQLQQLLRSLKLFGLSNLESFSTENGIKYMAMAEFYNI